MFKKTVYCCLVIFLLSSLILAVSPVNASPLRQGDLTLLVYGQTVDSRLDGSQPSIFYAFDALAGDVITITMIATDGILDPFIVLNDANRVPLATDDNSGGGVNARLTFVIPMSGRYLIQATNAGGIAPGGGGAFSLNLTASIDTSPIPTQAVEVSPTETSAPPSDIPAAQGDSVRLLKLQPGSTQDKLDRQVALRFYWFEAQEGDQIAVTPEPVSSFQPLLVLYDAGFVELSRAAPGTGLQFIFPKAGAFFLTVSLPDAGNAGGSYGFTAALSGNPATSGNFIDMVYNQSQRGSIDSNNSATTYRFQGSQGDSVTIAMNRVGGDLDSYLYLLDSAGQLLYEDNDSGGENGNARLTYTLPADGQYVIVATRVGQALGTTSGSYVLDLTSSAAPPPVVATVVPTLPADYADFPVITYGQTINGELSNARFMDVYTFLGAAGDAITIDLQSQNKDDPNGLDPKLVLLDDGRIPLIENDDILDGVQRDSHIEFILPRSAYYAIVATRFDQEAGITAGPYSLTLTGPTGTVEPATSEPANTPVIRKLSPALLAADAPLQATFNAGAALYSFSASAGALVDLSVTTDPGLDSVLILADENLNEVLSSGTGSLTGVTLPQTGEYLVVLAPRFGPVIPAGGGYILALTQSGNTAGTPDLSGPQTIAYGDTVQGVIDDQNTSHSYTFSGAAQDRIRITLKAVPGSTLDCYLELQDANGAVVEANDDINPGIVRDSQITVELPADGTYTLLASRYVGTDAAPTSGGYSLSLELLTGPATDGASSQIIPIAYGQTDVGEITDQQYIVFYAFDGTAGDVVSIELNNVSGNLDSVLHLYGAAGSQWVEIANNDDSPTGGTYEAALTDIALPETGKYLIAVNRFGLDQESTYGTFMITLTRKTG